MRFASLIVELIRARPRLVFWVAVLAQALLWLIVPALFYGSPPDDVAATLAFGHQYQVGSELGPPLAFWLADVAFTLAGGHIIGVYLLAQICFVVAFAALFALGRRVVGGQHAVIAVLLTQTVLAFSFPWVAFGPQILACPIWALILMHGWQVIGQGSRSAWFALSIEAGLLLLTVDAAPLLLLLLFAFALATAAGRRTLRSVDPLFSLLVIVVLVTPYLAWRLRAGDMGLPVSPMRDLGEAARQWGWLLGSLALAVSGIAVLLAFNAAWVQRLIVRGRETAPTVFRPPVGDLARRYVYFFALAPALLGTVVAALYEKPEVVGGAGIALLLSGLAVVVAGDDIIQLRRQQVLRTVWLLAIGAPAAAIAVVALVQPWLSAKEIRTSLPAGAIARFYGDSFQRRTNRPLPAVAGDRELALLIALGAARPQPLLLPRPAQGPWLTPARLGEQGGVVVWRAADTSGSVPPEIAKQFPGLVPEVPQRFDRLVDGRLPPVRVGWAIVRPKMP